MGITIGPADWWVASPEAIDSLALSCPPGTILPDGSALISREGGCAWIVAPSCTEVGSTWNGTTDTLVGNQPNISSWPTLCTRLLSCGFNPCDWFVPSVSQLQCPGYTCKDNWDSFDIFLYWSSTEIDATTACVVAYNNNGIPLSGLKSDSRTVRAFRCVTY